MMGPGIMLLALAWGWAEASRLSLEFEGWALCMQEGGPSPSITDAICRIFSRAMLARSSSLRGRSDGAGLHRKGRSMRYRSGLRLKSVTLPENYSLGLRDETWVKRTKPSQPDAVMSCILPTLCNSPGPYIYKKPT